MKIKEILIYFGLITTPHGILNIGVLKWFSCQFQSNFIDPWSLNELIIIFRKSSVY